MAPENNSGGALVPSTERPTFTAEDRAPVVVAEDDVLEAARNAVASGAFTAEEAARQWRLSAEETAALGKPRPRTRTPSALAAIEAELAEIAKYRRERKIAYYRDEATLAREQELLAKQARLKSLPAAARDAAVDDVLPPALQQRWQRQPGGVDGALVAIRGRLTMAWNDADPEDTELLKLDFDTKLPEEIQTEIALALAEDAGRWPKASAEQIDQFCAHEYGANLLKRWGPLGPAMLGVARGEVASIMASLNETSRLRLKRWFDSMPTAQKENAAMVLVARAVKPTAVRASGR